MDCVESQDEIPLNEGLECSSPVISLNALWGTEGCQTMRLFGKVKKQSLLILVDSGSTYNFIDQSVAKKLSAQCNLFRE